MTSVAENRFTDSDLAGLLEAVGAEPPVDPADFDRSFERLDIDSLARTEIAARVAERWHVDIEERLTASSTPEDVRRLVARALSGPAGR